MAKSSQRTRVRCLLLSLGLWSDLAFAAAKAGKSRAQFIRDTLALACVPNGVAPGQVALMKGEGYARVPAPVAPALEPEYLPVPTRADAEIGEITGGFWDVPGDWINGFGQRRDEDDGDPNHYYFPPPLDTRSPNGNLDS